MKPDGFHAPTVTKSQRGSDNLDLKHHNVKTKATKVQLTVIQNRGGIEDGEVLNCLMNFACFLAKNRVLDKPQEFSLQEELHPVSFCRPFCMRMNRLKVLDKD